MLFGSKPHLFQPIGRAISQLDDPTFRGVLLRSIVWSIACFVTLYTGVVWIIHRTFELNGWMAWSADILGSLAALILAQWLFLPVAAAIGTMYFDRIAVSVERRFYSWLPPAAGASLAEQTRDGITIAFKILALNSAALILACVLPAIGLFLGWMIAAYAIGRGLFVAVAMRRMPRVMAEALYRKNRITVLAQGAILALAAYIPVMNLLIPVLGVAAMTHVMDTALTGTVTPER